MIDLKTFILAKNVLFHEIQSSRAALRFYVERPNVTTHKKNIIVHSDILTTQNETNTVIFHCGMCTYVCTLIQLE